MPEDGISRYIYTTQSQKLQWLQPEIFVPFLVLDLPAFCNYGMFPLVILIADVFGCCMSGY